MKLETFFEKFEQFADAPNAVGKMRELILQLAIQGRLNSQANELVFPQVRLDSLGSWAQGCGFPIAEQGHADRPILFSKVSDMNLPGNEYEILKTIHTIDEETAKRLRIKVHPPGTVIFPKIGGAIATNKRRVLVRPTAIDNNCSGLIPNKSCSTHWLFLVLSAIDFAEYQSGTSVPAVNQGALGEIEVSLPPLAEQKRIVAKVDELMALCDRLEAQQQERDTRHAALARASLARFAEAPTPANLDFLFHQSYTITPADLRKFILTLAVQGKLVPQYPNDESADELITRIAEYRRAKKAKAYEPVAMEEAPYEVPFSWSWVRLGNISLTSDSGWSPQCLSEARSGTDWGVLKVSAVSWGVFNPEENKALPPGMIARPDCEVKAGDFLLSRANTEELVARSVVVDQTPPRLMMSDKIVRFRFPDEIEKAFINLANSSEPARDYYARNASGTSSSMKNIGRDVMCNLPIPLPPLAEQRRIVAKVDQLMALVDQLESQLAEAKAKSAALLEAIVHELLNPSAEVIDLASYRASIGCYTIKKMSQQPYFGRTAAMKTLYLAEAHVGMKLGFQPEREAAGPLDHWIYRFEEEGKQKAWFKAVENTSNGKMKVEYQPGKMLAAQAALAESQLAPRQRKEFDRLLDLLSDKKTEEVEIIATLFAVWNDFLIDGHAPSDDEIVAEVRENWHVKKERFAPTLLRQWLGWLRQNNLVPQGRSPHTVYQSQLLS